MVSECMGFSEQGVIITSVNRVSDRIDRCVEHRPRAPCEAQATTLHATFFQIWHLFPDITFAWARILGTVARKESRDHTPRLETKEMWRLATFVVAIALAWGLMQWMFSSPPHK